MALWPATPRKIFVHQSPNSARPVN
ncbi:hypothetical protein CCACVL1_13442 [Corchorus capsularis]|uniref:Uncharacterized protein n=1 Tax=Corchorus capsularis TaxID=210143 RepID=A0A1R3IB01_COCAP|nr:hypothetical protein CCACVL1_13442 [Corchorus capsularis]